MSVLMGMDMDQQIDQVIFGDGQKRTSVIKGG